MTTTVLGREGAVAEEGADTGKGGNFENQGKSVTLEKSSINSCDEVLRTSHFASTIACESTLNEKVRL